MKYLLYIICIALTSLTVTSEQVAETLVNLADTTPEKIPVLDYNKTCSNSNESVLASFSAYLTFNYDNKSNEVIVNNVSQSSVICSTNNQYLVIDFQNNSLILNFNNDNDTKLVNYIGFMVDDKFNFSANGEYFKVNIKNSYLCNNEGAIELKDHGKNVTAELILGSLHLDSFGHSNVVFREASECSTDVVGYVPIAVAVVLLVLLAIIFIGYFIIHRRDRRSSYQSV